MMTPIRTLFILFFMYVIYNECFRTSNYSIEKFVDTQMTLNNIGAYFISNFDSMFNTLKENWDTKIDEEVGNMNTSTIEGKIANITELTDPLKIDTFTKLTTLARDVERLNNPDIQLSKKQIIINGNAKMEKQTVLKGDFVNIPSLIVGVDISKLEDGINKNTLNENGFNLATIPR